MNNMFMNFIRYINYLFLSQFDSIINIRIYLRLPIFS